MSGISEDIQNRKIALLIDGENAPPSKIENIIMETEKYGITTIRRIYGDWTQNEMTSWKATLQKHAITPIQQFRNTKGKNATDSALIIDAMEIMYERSVEGFCIASSDSDYTRLATRMREKGFFVMGIGEEKTPGAFVNACNKFSYVELLTPPSTKTEEGTKIEILLKSNEPLSLLKQAFDMSVQVNGYAQLGTLGNALLKIDPSFDPRKYGYKQLSQMIKAYPKSFDIKHDEDKGPTAMYVKMKE